MKPVKNNTDGRSTKQLVGLVAGPVVALVLLLVFDLDPENPLVGRTAAVAALMAVWWITEAIPIPATALLPVALFPLLGIMKGKEVAATYFNHIIFLFIGGFLMALAMQRWNLHRRIALKIILLIGSSPKRIILGFMVATAFLSMWISNTATTMMMVPIAMAVIIRLRESDPSGKTSRFSVGLLIGIAYSASIGGVATLIGTPPNLSFTRIFDIYFPQGPEISFAGWILFGLPCSVLFLSIAWLLLTMFFVPKNGTAATDIQVFRQERRRLGKMTYEEKVVLILFSLLALLWLFRSQIALGSFVIPGWSTLFPVPGFIDDGTVAIAVAMLLFLIPARSQKNSRLMDWKTARGLRWGIVLLFGGGFALASGFKESGLSLWLAERLTGLSDVPPTVLVASICTMMTFLTELTSNTATTEMILPLLGSLGVAIKTNPLLLMIPATLSASCAFMLPVATPPNAIVFGSGEVRMSDMIRVGIVMNLIGVVLITGLIFLLGTTVFNIDLGLFPDWAVAQ
ncbi:MAG: SLC13/DASS family transporter [Candidatus Zixiibacteriota bacterium]|nr:MAG: SLC13/DASS family transporter [candidate division Zixibacteria bacterium]